MSVIPPMVIPPNISRDLGQMTSPPGCPQQIRVAFLITHGFVARTVLRSGVARRLISGGASVTIISPNADEAYFQQECAAEHIALRQECHGAGRRAAWFRANRPYLLDDVKNHVTLRVRHERRFRDRPVAGRAMLMLNRFISRSAVLRGASRAVECLVNRSEEVKQLLIELGPDLLVLSSPFGTRDTTYLIHARELGIETACQLLSWDNVTTKGQPVLMPDYFISWGPIMTDEIADMYHFPREEIYECGVSHFDVYTRSEEFTPREVILKEKGLRPEHPYIFYGMVPAYSSPNEVAIVEELANRVNKDGFARPCSLIIRPHPQTISGAYAQTPEALARLQALVGPRVALDFPSVVSDTLAWDVPKSDMFRLASLLHGSAMCLNANSTLCLDACMVDCPVIDVAFDGWDELPYPRSARRGLDYVHMAKLLALGGVRIAKSFDDLERHINAYLREPALDREGRARSVLQECGLQDGRAAERVAEVLARLGREAKSRRVAG